MIFTKTSYPRRVFYPVLGQCFLGAAPQGVAHTTNSTSLLIEQGLVPLALLPRQRRHLIPCTPLKHAAGGVYDRYRSLTSSLSLIRMMRSFPNFRFGLSRSTRRAASW